MISSRYRKPNSHECHFFFRRSSDRRILTFRMFVRTASRLVVLAAIVAVITCVFLDYAILSNNVGLNRTSVEHLVVAPGCISATPPDPQLRVNVPRVGNDHV